MRVTGGRLGGRRLRARRSGTRPTADRVRVALFARLGDLDGARVLDLYAGTGALGIEALSRGAREVVFIERAARSLAVLRANLASLGLDDRTPASSPATRSAASSDSDARRVRFDLVLLDPPYAAGEVGRALAGPGRGARARRRRGGGGGERTTASCARRRGTRPGRRAPLWRHRDHATGAAGPASEPSPRRPRPARRATAATGGRGSG